MDCEYGGSVTLDDDYGYDGWYRLRIYNGNASSIILSPGDLQRLQQRIHAILSVDTEEKPHP